MDFLHLKIRHKCFVLRYFCVSFVIKSLVHITYNIKIFIYIHSLINLHTYIHTYVGSIEHLNVFRPFYGYHRTDHQFLKIYMFNPRFIRRAANLLQNGAILNKVFHPHESHVPYILQFMIDYNLYGMSFLHVPQEVVKFRRKSENEGKISFKVIFLDKLILQR